MGRELRCAVARREPAAAVGVPGGADGRPRLRVGGRGGRPVRGGRPLRGGAVRHGPLLRGAPAGLRRLQGGRRPRRRGRAQRARGRRQPLGRARAGGRGGGPALRGVLRMRHGPRARTRRGRGRPGRADCGAGPGAPEGSVPVGDSRGDVSFARLLPGRMEERRARARGRGAGREDGRRGLCGVLPEPPARPAAD